jgi:ADP-ribose pyrophosphatase YjhB (NUDIX family)
MKQAGVMLVVKDGLILAVSRRYNKDIFGLPGGKFDEGVDRNSMDTAVRETLEETGVQVKHCVQVYQRIEQGDGPQGVDFYSTTYYATEYEGEPHTSEEGQVKWLTAEELTSTKAAFGDYNRHMLNNFKDMFPEIPVEGE